MLNDSTYLGGSANDAGSAIAVDANGDAFVAGTSGTLTHNTTVTVTVN